MKNLEEGKAQTLSTQSLYPKASHGQQDKFSTGSEDFVLDDDDARAADMNYHDL